MILILYESCHFLVKITNESRMVLVTIVPKCSQGHLCKKLQHFGGCDAYEDVSYMRLRRI
jgi:hypothetical protein